jgi:hypothetical protein
MAFTEIANLTQPVILLCVDVQVKIISPPHAGGEPIVPNTLQGEGQGRIFARSCDHQIAPILKEQRT